MKPILPILAYFILTSSSHALSQGQIADTGCTYGAPLAVASMDGFEAVAGNNQGKAVVAYNRGHEVYVRLYDKGSGFSAATHLSTYTAYPTLPDPMLVELKVGMDEAGNVLVVGVTQRHEYTGPFADTRQEYIWSRYYDAHLGAWEPLTEVLEQTTYNLPFPGVRNLGFDMNRAGDALILFRRDPFGNGEGKDLYAFWFRRDAGGDGWSDATVVAKTALTSPPSLKLMPHSAKAYAAMAAETTTPHEPSELLLKFKKEKKPQLFVLRAFSTYEDRRIDVDALGNAYIAYRDGLIDDQGIMNDWGAFIAHYRQGKPGEYTITLPKKLLLGYVTGASVAFDDFGRATAVFDRLSNAGGAESFAYLFTAANPVPLTKPYVLEQNPQDEEYSGWGAELYIEPDGGMPTLLRTLPIQGEASIVSNALVTPYGFSGAQQVTAPNGQQQVIRTLALGGGERLTFFARVGERAKLLATECR